MFDVYKLNKKLYKQNRVSILKLNQHNVGDKVRYLVEKNVFDTGSKKYSDTIGTITDITGYNIKIELADRVMYKKHWQLLKV